MMQLRTIGLAGLAAMAALLPLYGDPRSAPVTHPKWARMMLRGMDLEESLDATGSATKVFSALSWRENLWLQGAQSAPGSHFPHPIVWIDVGPDGLAFFVRAPVPRLRTPSAGRAGPPSTHRLITCVGGRDRPAPAAIGDGGPPPCRVANWQMDPLHFESHGTDPPQFPTPAASIAESPDRH